MPELSPFEPRAVCMRCRRPASVCYCQHLTSIETATRIVLLQHPRERDVAIGTARMASLCLPNSELHVGVHWQDSPELARALSDPARPAALLYPGEGAIDVVEHPPAGPITLIVVDGTWWQAKKLVRENPQIAALPRYAFVPPSPSEYRIRREPKETYVSTIEALMHVLGALEGNTARFAALLTPFRAMIDAQIEHQQRLRGARHGRPHRVRPPGPKPRRLLLPPVLRERAGDLVCVVGEANAWPYRRIERSPAHPDELVQWLACRVSTGELFDCVIAPRKPLGPNTTTHTELSAERLAAGGSVEELADAWSQFIRPTDLICAWGYYAASLFLEAGIALPGSLLDLRTVTRNFARGKVGSPGELTFPVATPVTVPLGSGRGGVRLAQVVSVVRHFMALAQECDPAGMPS